MRHDPFGNPYFSRLVSRMRPVTDRRSGSGDRGATFEIAAQQMPDGSAIIVGDGMILSINNTGTDIKTPLTLAQGPNRDVILNDNYTPGKTLGIQIKFRNGLYVLTAAPLIKITGVYL